MADSDDERTAAEAPSAIDRAADVSSVDRYKIERRLGEGGMGVVYAAFDPELERTVALKVMRAAAGDDQSQGTARLMREARAMARLSHPNVVAIYEVGQETAEGRSFVAMELVDGETLAEWLRAKRRAPNEILDALAAAGEGLAAAHAAGLVHRDFKPHNVLRRSDGRILVTDFGLARGAHVTEPGSLAADEDMPAQISAALPHVTAIGSVVGTPAYMAPEQWKNGTVGPAADQFAFAVVLWEALSGERPYRGKDTKEMRAQVMLGEPARDDAQIPIRLRTLLARGLEADPAKRWPSMRALLDELRRARRPVALRATAIVAGLAAIGTIGYFATRSSTAPVPSGPTCPSPAREVEAVWRPGAAQELEAKKRGNAVIVLRDTIAKWSAVRERACGTDSIRRGPILACLDGVLARFDAVRQAIVRSKSSVSTDHVVSLLVDPAVCELSPPPRLSFDSTPDIVDGLAIVLESWDADAPFDDKRVAAIAESRSSSTCLRALAWFARRYHRGDPKFLAPLLDAAAQCADDRLIADAHLMGTLLEFEAPFVGPRGEAALVRTERAVNAIRQPDVVALLDFIRARAAANREDFDGAIQLTARAIESYGLRYEDQLETATYHVRYLIQRGRPADLAAARVAIAKWRPRAVELKLKWAQRSFDDQEERLLRTLGDVAGARAAAARLDAYTERQPIRGARSIDGVVVDRAGRGVANAVVVTGTRLRADAATFHGGYDRRSTKTDEAGRFRFAEGPASGYVVAQVDHDGLPARSRPFAVTANPASNVRLTLEPGRRFEGALEVGGRVKDLRVYAQPVEAGGLFFYEGRATNGAFVIEGVPPGPLRIVARADAPRHGHRYATLLVDDRTPVTGLSLALPATSRSLDVIVRSSMSSSLEAVFVIVVPGKVAIRTTRDLDRAGERARLEGYGERYSDDPAFAALAGKARTGDLIARFSDVYDGDVTACAITLGQDWVLPGENFIDRHWRDMEPRCVPIARDATAIQLEAPPMKRFD